MCGSIYDEQFGQPLQLIKTRFNSNILYKKLISNQGAAHSMIVFVPEDLRDLSLETVVVGWEDDTAICIGGPINLKRQLKGTKNLGTLKSMLSYMIAFKPYYNDCRDANDVIMFNRTSKSACRTHQILKHIHDSQEQRPSANSSFCWSTDIQKGYCETLNKVAKLNMEDYQGAFSKWKSIFDVGLGLFFGYLIVTNAETIGHSLHHEHIVRPISSFELKTCRISIVSCCPRQLNG